MNRMEDGIERTRSRVPRVACMSEGAAKRYEAERKALAVANGAELVTLDCRITLTRDQWGTLAKRMGTRATMQRIGMSSMDENDLIVLQVMQQHAAGQ